MSLRMQIERALADKLLSPVDGANQPGLFDTAALRALETGRAIKADIEREHDAVSERLRLAADVEAGRPALEIVWRQNP